MNRLTDLVLATQMSTSCAFACAIGAHLVSNHANENWQFSVYFLLTLAVLFMLFPHIVTNKEE